MVVLTEGLSVPALTVVDSSTSSAAVLVVTPVPRRMFGLLTARLPAREVPSLYVPRKPSIVA